MKLSNLLWPVIVPVFFTFVARSQELERSANLNFKNENYISALDDYLKLYKKDTSNYIYNARIGICYLNTNFDRSLAIPYLEKALAQKNSESALQLFLGRALFHAHRFDEAETSFNQVLSSGNSEEREEANLFLQMLENARQFVQNPVDISFIKLGKDINSPLDDFNPFVTVDENYLFYTTNRKYDREFNVFIYDCYVSSKSKKGWKKGKGIQNLSTVEDECIVGISNNFILCQFKHYAIFEDIILAPRKGESVTIPTASDEIINSKFTESGAWLSESEDTLYFSSGCPGGIGKLDLYYSIKLPDGTWGNPINMGESINTVYDEDFPRLSADGKTFFFSSNRPESMGGYDIFSSRFNEETNSWETPVNLGYPINSTYDNFTISYCGNGRYAYISDVRPGGEGGLDIYKIVFNNTAPPINLFKYTLAFGTPEAPINFVADSSIKITINISNITTGETTGQYVADKNGCFIAALNPGKYMLKISGETIDPYSEAIEVSDEQKTAENKNIFITRKTQ